MDNFKRIIEILNDLIKINKDREAGYVKATRELTPAEHNLRGVFERKAQESRNNVVQLERKMEELGDINIDDEGQNNGHSHEPRNFWDNIKDFFSGNSKESILRSCIDGDEAIVKCYEDALNQPFLPQDVTSILEDQKKTLTASNMDLKNLIEIDRSGEEEELPR